MQAKFQATLLAIRIVGRVGWLWCSHGVGYGATCSLSYAVDHTKDNASNVFFYCNMNEEKFDPTISVNKIY